MPDLPNFQTIYLTKQKLSLNEKIDFKKYSGLIRACIFVSQRKSNKANERIFLNAEWNSSNDYRAKGTFFEDDLGLKKPFWSGEVGENWVPKEKFWKKFSFSGILFLITTIITTGLLLYTTFNELFANPQIYSEATFDSSDDLNFTKGSKINARLKVVNTSEHVVLKVTLKNAQLLPLNPNSNSIELNFDKVKKINFVGIRNEKTIPLNFHKKKILLTPGKYRLLIDMEIKAGLIRPCLSKQIEKKIRVWEKHWWTKKAQKVAENLCKVRVIFGTGVNFKNGISVAAILTGYENLRFLSVGSPKIKGGVHIDHVGTTCRIEWQTKALKKYQKYLFEILVQKNNKSIDCPTLTKAINMKYSEND